MLKTAALTLAVVGAAVAQSSDEERVRDWGRVHELQPGQQIEVRPFKGLGDKVFATYVSSDAFGIVVRLKSDQELQISKDRIRSVIRRKRMRNAIRIGAGAGFAVMALWSLFLPDLIQPWAALLHGGVGAGFGALGGGLVRVFGRNLVVYQAGKQPRRQSSNLGAPDAGKLWPASDIKWAARPFAKSMGIPLRI